MEVHSLLSNISNKQLFYLYGKLVPTLEAKILFQQMNNLQHRQPHSVNLNSNDT